MYVLFLPYFSFIFTALSFANKLPQEKYEEDEEKMNEEKMNEEGTCILSSHPLVVLILNLYPHKHKHKQDTVKSFTLVYVPLSGICNCLYDASNLR